MGHFGEGTLTLAANGPARVKEHTPAWTGLLVLAIAIFFFEGALLAKP